jgi:hypothetical protein
VIWKLIHYALPVTHYVSPIPAEQFNVRLGMVAGERCPSYHLMFLPQPASLFLQTPQTLALSFIKSKSSIYGRTEIVYGTLEIGGRGSI